jgi:hypothetical protein
MHSRFSVGVVVAFALAASSEAQTPERSRAFLGDVLVLEARLREPNNVSSKEKSAARVLIGGWPLSWDRLCPDRPK